MTDSARDGAVVESARVERLSLSAAFRQRTRLLHTQAERSGVVNDLLTGRATRLGHGMLLRNLLPVYEQLEIAMETRRLSPAFAGLALRAVYRAAAIERDLEALFGPAWADSLPMLPAGTRYARRIAAVAGGDGFGLIAHAYVRYLGDLNGGQVLKRLLIRSLGLEPAGLSFFDFPEIHHIEGFRIDYRDAIDRSAWEIADIAPVIEEAATAFQLNIALSDAIGQAAHPDRGRPGPGDADPTS